MQMILTYPDLQLGSYFTVNQVNGRWVVNFIWAAHQAMQFDMSEVRKISDIIISRVHITGNYGYQPNGNIARVGNMSIPYSEREDVPFGAPFDVELDTDIGSSGTYNVVASYVTKTRAVQDGQTIPGYTYKNGRYYTFVSVSSIKLIVEYQSATTPCTGPTTVALDREVAETVAVLSWSGAAGGTNNSVSSYQVEYRDLPDGAWTAAESTTSQSMNVSPNPVRGAYRQFRVRAVGTAGEAYASEWVVLDDLLRTNIVPGRPGNVVPALDVVEDNSVGLSWTASEAGLSAVVSYRIEGQVENGDWVLINAAVSGLSCTASMLDAERGQMVGFRVRATDAQGGVSAWSFSPLVRKNRAPLAPRVVWPTNGASCLSKRPIIGISIPAEPDGQMMTVQVRMGHGIWKNAGVIPGNGATCYAFRLPADVDTSETDVASAELPFTLPNVLGEVEGSVVYIRVTDSLGAGSDYISIIISREEFSWTRTIRTGTVIADNNGISHQADLAELLQTVNGRLSWFNRSLVSYDTEVGWFANWLPQMQQLHGVLASMYATVGESVDPITQEGNAPTAATINLIRALCKGREGSVPRGL